MGKVNGLLTILLLLTSVNVLWAQFDDKITQKEVYSVQTKAEENFSEKNYIDALYDFKRLYEFDQQNVYYKLMTGICYSYTPEEKEKSITLLEEVKRENKEQEQINYYLGRAYAANYQFDKAINQFNQFLEKAKAEDVEEKKIAERMIKNSRNAKKILADTIHSDVITNMKTPINSQYSEYVPVISGDGSVMIFTYRGIRSENAENVKESMSSVDYDEDIFISYKKNGEWTEPVSIGDNINTKTHDAAIALSVDGQTLFLYKSTYTNSGDIYMSKLNGSVWSKPEKLKGEVNTNNSWEGSCSLAADGKTLYFASDRNGGYGGRDLYKATLKPDGTWGNVKNLGETINTIYNDDAPFIHSDGKTLYFSSEGHSSIGGYDIFSSKLLGKTGFAEPENLGCPINTINDNRYFVLAADGRTGYYSSDGKNSIGEHDIFKITRGDVTKPLLALYVGKVYLDDQPTGAYMSVYKRGDDELKGTYKANETTGKYIMTLPPGFYDVEIQLLTGEIALDSFNLVKLRDYTRITHEFRLYSDSANIEGNDILQASIAAAEKDELTSLSVLVTEDENDLFKEEIDAMFDKSSLKEEVKLTDVKDLKELGVGKKVTLENILYDFDRATLRPESIEELNILIDILKNNPEAKVEISSHTDSWGEANYNLALSQSRAKSVVDYLVKNGIKQERLVAKGYGETTPKFKNNNIAHRQKNRRTEFKVLGFIY